MIINEKERLISYTRSAKRICDGKCCSCFDDERNYGGLGIDNSYGVCPVGFSLGRRIEEYAENNPSKNHVIGTARSLQELSIIGANAKEIKSGIKSLASHLEQGEKPLEFNLPEIKVSHVSTKIIRMFSKSFTRLF